MFGDLMGNLQDKQSEMKSKLALIKLEASVANGAVVVNANANRQIENISISKELFDQNDVEQLEDLVLEAVNRAMDMAQGKEAEESQKMIQDIMPPGLGGLGNLFG